jgi:hypothetical protein
MPVEMIRGAGGGGLFDQRKVVVLEAGDFVGGGAKIFQEFYGGFIKQLKQIRPTSRARHDRAMPLPGGVGLLVEIVQVLAGPEGIGIADLEAAPAHDDHYRDGGANL